MPPTKHMTGDVPRVLLDGFFNLVGAMTGQGILSRADDRGGCHAWLPTATWRCRNVRYVFNAAGRLGE